MARPSSTLCPSCGQLVGVKDAECLNCGRRNPGMWGLAHLFRGVRDEAAFAQLVLWVCGSLYLASLAADLEGVRTGGISFVSPSIESLFMFGASGAVPVFGFGRWWTVLSASWLHGGVLHILFNMYWVRNLALPAAHLYGPGRAVIIYTVSGVTAFVASSVAGALPFLPSFLRGANLTIGASASIFGLLGALVYYGRRGGSTALGQQAWTWAVVLFVFGFIMPGIDNFAHLGGFLGGYGMSWVLNPFQPEKVDHLLAALIGLGLTLAAILASVVLGLPLVAR